MAERRANGESLPNICYRIIHEGSQFPLRGYPTVWSPSNELWINFAQNTSRIDGQYYPTQDSLRYVFFFLFCHFFVLLNFAFFVFIF